MSADEIRHAGLNLGATDELTHEQAGSGGVRLLGLPDERRGDIRAAVRHLRRMLPATVGGPDTGERVQDRFPPSSRPWSLLTSSFTFGMASVAMKYGAPRRQLLGWMGVTLVLGAGFLGMELHDFATMFADGAYPTRSGYLSAFFALVPLHGLHVFFGSLWIIVMMVQMLTLRAGCARQDQHPAARPVLAFPRHRLDRDLFGRLSAGADPVSGTATTASATRLRSYAIGYGLALAAHRRGLRGRALAMVRRAATTLGLVLGLGARADGGAFSLLPAHQP